MRVGIHEVLYGLPTLYLIGTQVSDAGVVHLKRLTSLKRLGLIDTQVSDTGLEHLKGLTNLEVLSLGGTLVSDAGIEKLQQKLPNCTISHLPAVACNAPVQ